MFKKVTALLAEKAAHAQTIATARREFLKRTLGAVAVVAVTPALATTAACGDDDDDATGTDGTGDDDDSTNTTGSTTDGGTTADGGTTETTGSTTDGGTTDGGTTDGSTTDGGTTDGAGTETDGSTTDGGTTETTDTTGGDELPATAQKFGAADSVQTGTLAKFPSARIIIGRDAAGYYAFTSICTHLRCDTSKNFGTIDGDSLTCTCHSSTFDKDGKNTGGPAKSPLANKKVYIVGGELYVDPAEDVPAGTRATA
jgi:Rieske Fe-S protein